MNGVLPHAAYLEATVTPLVGTLVWNLIHVSTHENVEIERGTHTNESSRRSSDWEA